MRYRVLGSTNLKVSVVGVGTWQFGGEWAIDFTQSAVNAIFDAARECGVNLIDTAECYGDHLSEELVGKAVRRDREKWIIATKFGHKFNKVFQRDWIISPAAVLQQLEDSLRALKTDYIDLYQFHSGNDASFETEGLWELLAKEKEKGRIRHLGISISPSTNMFQTERANAVDAEAIQVLYNRMERGAEEEVFPAAQRQNLGVLARVPLASGLLSGKYKPGAQFAPGDVREVWGKETRDERLEEVQRIARTEVPAGVDMAQWALAWCLKNPAVTTVIPGCKSPEQVRSNCAATELILE